MILFWGYETVVLVVAEAHAVDSKLRVTGWRTQQVSRTLGAPITTNIVVQYSYT